MDPSLAKGLKNQLFREIDDDLSVFIKKWAAYVRSSNPQKSRSNWTKFSQGIEDLFGQFMLASHVGGTARKPFLCLSTFENDERIFNTWSEKCFTSKIIYFNYDPIGVNSEHSGFNISEHAIQRIFERSYSDFDPLGESFKKINFTNELRMVPLWSFFWSLKLTELTYRENSIGQKMQITIPAVSGLLLGEISSSNTHKAEIRTFVSLDQLSENQYRIWEMMIDISKKYLKSVVPFLFFEFIYAKPGSQDAVVEFLMCTEELMKLIYIVSSTDPE
jgi:hypothetical protein